MRIFVLSTTHMETQALITYIQNKISLSEADIAVLNETVIIRDYIKGQYLLQQGDICRYSAFILSGCAKTFLLDDDGNEHVLNFAVEDWWCGDIASYVRQTPADYNIQFLENTKVVLFPKEKEEELFEKIPKLERFFRLISEGGLIATQKRIVRGFSMTAKEHYIYFSKQYPHIEQRIPQYMLASYLGITKEFLSKIKKQIALKR